MPGDIYDEDSVILTTKRKKKKKKKKKHDSFKTTASKDGTLSSKLKNAFKPPWSPNPNNSKSIEGSKSKEETKHI